MFRLSNTGTLVRLLGLCCVMGSLAAAQAVQKSEPEIVSWKNGISGLSCEHTKLKLDMMLTEGGADKTIIIIARLGSGEFARKLSRRRLQNLQGYLIEVRGVEGRRVVTAVGDRVKGPGQVEIYVGGELSLIFEMGRNKDFFSGCEW